MKCALLTFNRVQPFLYGKHAGVGYLCFPRCLFRRFHGLDGRRYRSVGNLRGLLCTCFTLRRRLRSDLGYHFRTLYPFFLLLLILHCRHRSCRALSCRSLNLRIVSRQFSTFRLPIP